MPDPIADPEAVDLPEAAAWPAGFYACPYCNHNDPNYLNFANALQLNRFRDRCFKCKRDLRISKRAWGAHMLILLILGMILIVASHSLIAVGDSKRAGFVLLGGGGGLTIFQFFLPRLFFRFLGLRMYEGPDRNHSK